MEKTNHQITLYVVSGCPLCDGARAWLDKHSLEYTERNVGNDFGALRAMYELTRQNLVPVFETGGQALVRPSEDELAKLII